MVFNVDYFLECLESGIKYIPNTLKLVVIPLLIGCTFGIIIALIRVYKVPFLHKFLTVFVTIYQGIPIVVALFIYNLLFVMMFDELVDFLNIKVAVKDIDNIWVGVFALTLYAVCIMTETFRGALLAVDKGQNEAGYAIGLSKVQTIRRIIIPQMMPVAIPMMINNIVGLIKASSVAMTIGITEITIGSLIPSSRTYSFFEGYVAAALIFWIITMAIEVLAGHLRKHTYKFKRSAYD